MMSRKWLLPLITIIGLFGLASFTYAQDEKSTERLEPAIHFTHLTSDDGLAQNAIEAILQDSRGFMWFGTPSGLSRYDGYRFTTYQNDPDNPNSLSSNWVRDLYEDRDGMLWVATEGGGVNRYDSQTDTFTRYVHDDQNPNSLAGDRVFQAFQDSNGDYWFAGAGLTGVNRYNPRTETYTSYVANPQDPTSYRGGNATDILEDDSGNLWLSAGHVLVKYNLGTEEFTYYEPPTNGDQREERLSVLHPDAEGNIWTGGTIGLYRFDPQREEFTYYANPRRVNDLIEDANGIFWIATGGGLDLFDPRTGQVTGHYDTNPTHEDSLSNDSVIRLYQDREGVIWIATADSGLNIYDPRQAHFAHYRYDPNAAMSLAEGGVNDIYTADGNQLWVGIRGTLDLIDLDTMQVTHYPLEPSAGVVNAIYQDHAGIVWVGTNGLRLYSLDPSTGEFTAFPLQSAVMRPTPPKGIVAFYEDEDENLWVAVNHDGLYRLDSARENVEFYETPPPASSQINPENADDSPRSSIRAPISELYRDSAGNIWLTTLNGFHRFDPRTGTFKTLRAKGEGSAADSYMESLLEDPDGIIWIASRDGLIRFDPTTETARYFTEKDGLPSSYLVGILRDTDGNLWLSSKRGLSRFTPATGTFRNYEVSDGLQGTEFAIHAFAQTADGRMFFGGLNGLTAFYPEQVTDNPYQPTVVFTDFQLFNKSVLPTENSALTHPIWETGSLTLKHDQNILSFEFAALSYADPSETHYRHKLEGFESDWNETDSTRRFITYTNLPTGNYVLRVQSTNNDGIWSDESAALQLTILPPWWEETWFRGLAVVAFVGALFGGYQWRVIAIKRRNRALEMEVTERTRALQERSVQLQTSEEHLRHAKEAAEAANRAKSAFLANMSHELRSPLNVILGFTQVVNRNQQLSPEVHENLDIILQSGEHLLALINQVLDLSKIEAGHLSLNEVEFDFLRLFGDLEDMFQLKAEEKQLELLFDQPDDMPRYLRADAVKLRQVLINLIGNALKFTDEGYITIRVKQGQGNNNLEPSALNLRFEVEDSGVGIATEELSILFEAFSQTSTGRQVQEGTGLGLSITRKFIQMMGGDITVKSEAGRGTTFAFNIPCQVVASVAYHEPKIQRRVVGLEAGQPRYRVLIVDDKWANRQLLMKLLSPLGFDLREAENGKEGVEIAQVFNPHLVFMDMRMPVMNGYDATQKIKAAPECQLVVVVALTASAFDEERAAVLAAGCSNFLRKPFRAEDVFEMMSKHIGVRYLYAEDDERATAVKGKTQTSDLKSALNGMPSELLVRLTEATELGDIQMMSQVITDIRQHDSTLAEDIAWLAHRFEYDKLLYLLQEVVQ